MRENYSKERRQKVASINKGKTLSLLFPPEKEETREFLRKAALLREPMSTESRMKCATNTRPVIITNLDGSNPIQFVSIKEASLAISCSEKTIQRALKKDFTSSGIIKNKYIVKEVKDIVE